MRRPTSSFENKLRLKGHNLIAGVDEAGRGPLAGPVVAAAVIFPPNTKIKGIADSKLLTAEKRGQLYYEIKAKAFCIGIAKVGPELIDKINIGKADLLAMKKAVEQLSLTPDYLLIDGGRYRIELDIPQQGIVSGDKKCFVIAAASIIAKVTRDRIMTRYHNKFPQYDFHLHKGYGTKRHYQKLQEHGPSPIHRKSFALKIT